MLKFFEAILRGHLTFSFFIVIRGCSISIKKYYDYAKRSFIYARSFKNPQNKRNEKNFQTRKVPIRNSPKTFPQTSTSIQKHFRAVPF